MAVAKVPPNQPAVAKSGPTAVATSAQANPPAKKPAPQPQKPAAVFELKSSPQVMVQPARPKRRHFLLAASFVVMVLLPAAVVVAYLYLRAEDRFASTSAFSVHREDSSGAMELMAGLPSLGVTGGITPDADILYQFIRSQRMVELVNAQMDLRAIYGAAHETDPIFALDPAATLEEMVEYWDRIVSLVFEPDTGLITVEVSAFEPGVAQQINQIMLDESSALINQLSKIARDDTISQAEDELERAASRVRDTRLQMAKFRDLEQIIDPTADFTGQMGVITALQQSLAEAMIRRDMLVGTTTNPDDQRIIQAERTIEAIQNRIADERDKVGARTDPQGAEDDPLSRIVGQYESLVVDREFAERSYVAALAAYDAALADARRKSRYLAVHIPPTQAETAIYPDRSLLSIAVAAFLVMFWALFVLTAYSIRDRR
jgi:capsular polysaccharide transport system permease protein